MTATEKDPVASAVVKKLEQAWTAIQRRHRELPPVIFTLGSGTIDKGPHRLGHFAPNRWHSNAHAAGDPLPEVFVSGEGLRAGGTQVLGTLLHEGAHALGHVKGIQDTSRGGRYHNKRYKDLAELLGLEVAQVGAIGWSDTTVPDATAASYARTVATLDDACNLWRSAEQHAHNGKKPPNTNLAVAQCQCPRKIRVAAGTLELGPIWCGVCGADFELVVAD
jgi:hypothetical protein